MATIEIQRNNTTPKAFWNACVKACEIKGDSMPVIFFDEWANDFEYNYTMRMDLFGIYSTIIEFNFEDDKTGWGYFYMTETN